jgi:hypothetical protein
MAKGQKRSGREAKKPKKDKLVKSAPAAGSMAAARTAQKPAK